MCNWFILNYSQFLTPKSTLSSTSPSYVLTDSRFMTCRMMWYSSEMPFPPSMSLACLAMSRALPQLFLFSKEIISGDALLGNWQIFCISFRENKSPIWLRCLIYNLIHQKQRKEFSLLFLINESSQLQTGLQTDGDLRQHVSHLLLHQLIPCQWHTKLDSGENKWKEVKSKRKKQHQHKRLNLFLTCQVCTVELHGSKTLLHQVIPKQYHNVRYSDSRKVP